VMSSCSSQSASSSVLSQPRDACPHSNNQPELLLCVCMLLVKVDRRRFLKK
jgi:hypothetical protein